MQAVTFNAFTVTERRSAPVALLFVLYLHLETLLALICEDEEFHHDVRLI